MHKPFAKYWDGLCLFLSDGRIEIDNNPVERTIRPIALNRKNALFAGHDTGTQNWAVIASLIETCKLNRIEPHGNLSGVLTAIAGGHQRVAALELRQARVTSTPLTQGYLDTAAESQFGSVAATVGTLLVLGTTPVVILVFLNMVYQYKAMDGRMAFSQVGTFGACHRRIAKKFAPISRFQYNMLI